MFISLQHVELNCLRAPLDLHKYKFYCEFFLLQTAATK